MNAGTHAKALLDKIYAQARGEGSEGDNTAQILYDEYLAVMDMTAEFYLSTVERIFKGSKSRRPALR